MRESLYQDILRCYYAAGRECRWLFNVFAHDVEH